MALMQSVSVKIVLMHFQFPLRAGKFGGQIWGQVSSIRVDTEPGLTGGKPCILAIYAQNIPADRA